MDGHERPDVQDFRQGWVKRMLDNQTRMALFSGENMELVEEPALDEGERKLVQVTHDECAFHAHDGMKSLWLLEGEQVLRKKGEGRALMVSGFVCPCHGVLDTEYIQVGKNHDGYWQSHDMIKHVSFI